jgi:hypothetical protein
LPAHFGNRRFIAAQEWKIFQEVFFALIHPVTLPASPPLPS